MALKNYIPTINEFPGLGRLHMVDGYPCFEEKKQFPTQDSLNVFQYLELNTPFISGKIMRRGETEQNFRKNLLMEIKKTLNSAQEMGFKVANQDEVGFYLFEFPDVASNIIAICKKLRDVIPEAEDFQIKVSYDREDPTDKSLAIEIFADKFSEVILDKVLSFYDNSEFDFLDGSNGWIHISQAL
ncbi:MAG: hypothetical protein PHD82_08660 [Candidatus Riflebacteria bacterium]|nr:hypothetical protein [Candidatus Riflebacteria bacterium]